jgi:uncharacterized membrane protein YbhN (UPF0104 family)
VSPHTLLSFAFAVAILVFVIRRLDINPAAIWAQIQRANPLYLAVAFMLWYGAFFVRAWRWGRMIDTAREAGAHDREVPATPRLAEIVCLSYFANSVVPAKLGDAYRSYLLKRDTGISMSAGFGTILAERVVDAVVLVVVLAGTALVVFGAAMPSQAQPALTLGAVLLVAAAIGLGLMWLTRDVLVRVLPGRAQGIYSRLHGAVFGALRRPVPIIGLGILLWLGDGTRVWLVSKSLNAGISPAVAILVATMGALLTIIPFTPAGLGVVELGVGSLLIGVVGLDPVMAGSIILLDRVVVFWSLLVVGTVLYLRRTRRDYATVTATAPSTG